MTNLNQDLQTRLTRLARNRSIPFCYQCYVEVPLGICKTCFTDDTMNLLPEVGVEYGTSWIIEHLIRENLTPLSTDEAFLEFVRECYSETIKVAWLELDVADVTRTMDPVSWEMARSEWLDTEQSEGIITSFDGGVNYYYVQDIERYLEEEESKYEVYSDEAVGSAD